MAVDSKTRNGRAIVGHAASGRGAGKRQFKSFLDHVPVAIGSRNSGLPSASSTSTRSSSASRPVGVRVTGQAVGLANRECNRVRRSPAAQRRNRRRSGLHWRIHDRRFVAGQPRCLVEHHSRRRRCAGLSPGRLVGNAAGARPGPAPTRTADPREGHAAARAAASREEQSADDHRANSP